jgi:3-isopropylmalate/(R)-2-methylmalate dehydratase small subunit
VWALVDYGFKVIIAVSFAEIFYNNCVKNGLLAVTLKSPEVDELFGGVSQGGQAKITADLSLQMICGPNGEKYSFEIGPFAKECLLKGLDSIGWTLQFGDKISVYENKIKVLKPWLR